MDPTPDLPCRVFIRIAPSGSRCSTCRGGRHQVAYHLFAADATGAIFDYGVEICPHCAERPGLDRACLLALDTLEGRLLKLARANGVGELALRLEFGHVRGLLSGGQVESPPSIPARCFDARSPPAPLG